MRKAFGGEGHCQGGMEFLNWAGQPEGEEPVR